MPAGRPSASRFVSALRNRSGSVSSTSSRPSRHVAGTGAGSRAAQGSAPAASGSAVPETNTVFIPTP